MGTLYVSPSFFSCRGLVSLQSLKRHLEDATVFFLLFLWVYLELLRRTTEEKKGIKSKKRLPGPREPVEGRRKAPREWGLSSVWFPWRVVQPETPIDSPGS